MEEKKISVGPYNLHIIKTDKFNKVIVDINFRRPIKKDEITLRNLLSHILIESTKKYANHRQLGLKAEELYNLYINSEVNTLGNFIINNFTLIMLNEKYSSKGMFEESLKFLCEIIFNPNIKKDMFPLEFFNLAKKSVETAINSMKDDLESFSIKKMLEEMSPDSPISFNINGYLDDLNKITSEELYTYYQKMIKSDLVDIVVLGDVDIEETVDLIKKNIDINTIKRYPTEVTIKHKKTRLRAKKKFLIEDTPQGKLSIGCKIIDMTKYEFFYVSSLYSLMLGRSGDSRLFRNIREKHGMAYYIKSLINSTKGFMLIYAGINKKNFDKCYRLIRHELLEMKKGNIKESELENAKKIYISGIKNIQDSPIKLVSNRLIQELLDSDDYDKIIEKIKKVSIKDIINFSKKIKVDTVFLLHGGEKDGSD